MSYHINEMLMEILPLERSRLYIDILTDFEILNYFQHRLQFEDVLMMSDSMSGGHITTAVDDIISMHIDVLIERHGIRLNRDLDLNIVQRYALLKGILTLGSLSDPTVLQDSLGFGGDSISKFVNAVTRVTELADFELYEWIEFVDANLIETLAHMSVGEEGYVVENPSKALLANYHGYKDSTVVKAWLSTGVPLGFPLQVGFEQIRESLRGLSIEKIANELMTLTIASGVSESYVEEATSLVDKLFGDITFTAKAGRYYLDHLPEDILNA